MQKSVFLDSQVHGRSLVEAAPSTVHARRSTMPATLDEAGSLYGRLVPWDTPATVSDDGRRTYRESFAPGGLTAPGEGTIPVYYGHRYGPDGNLEHGPLVGRVDDLAALDDGFYGRVILADVPAAAELRALAHTVGATFSVEFSDDGAGPGSGDITRTAARLEAVAVMTAPERGSYAGAEVLSVRAEPPAGAVTDPPEGDEDEDDGDDDGENGEEGPVEGSEAVARHAIQREVRRYLGRGAAPTPTHPLARYANAYELHAAARLSTSDELPRLFATAYRQHQEIRARAWVNQTTTANPGVMAPGWLNEVFGILDMGRPVITAIGSRPLPAEGMEIDWPYFDGDLHTLVGPQVGEKTDIVSVAVALKKASTAITTYAGGSDLSWQLIRRSSPAYRDAYLRIMQSAYGVVTDQAATTAVAAAAGSTIPVDVTGDTDGALLRSAIFSASSKVQLATGTPANIVLAATDVFVGFAALPTMMPGSYGTQNISGTATASTLDVNVSGLQVVMAPDLADGTAIVTNRSAAAWMEDGPFVVAAPDIPKLGEDVAIWGMGAFGAFLAQGIVKLTVTLPAPPPLAASSSSSGSTKSSK